MQVASGEQKFIMKTTSKTENTNSNKMKSKYSEYKFSVKKNDTEWMQEEGFIEVELSEDMMDDLMINQGFREEIINGTKKVLGRL